jgi:hypothetical protein
VAVGDGDSSCLLPGRGVNWIKIGDAELGAKRLSSSRRPRRSMLARRLLDCEVSRFPCETDATRPLPGIQSAHAQALRESKVAHFYPYDCCHTWATRAVQAGIDLVTLAAMLDTRRSTWFSATPIRRKSIRRRQWTRWSSMSANRRLLMRSNCLFCGAPNGI